MTENVVVTSHVVTVCTLITNANNSVTARVAIHVFLLVGKYIEECG